MSWSLVKEIWSNFPSKISVFRYQHIQKKKRKRNLVATNAAMAATSTDILLCSCHKLKVVISQWITTWAVISSSQRPSIRPFFWLRTGCKSNKDQEWRHFEGSSFRRKKLFSPDPQADGNRLCMSMNKCGITGNALQSGDKVGAAALPSPALTPLRCRNTTMYNWFPEWIHVEQIIGHPGFVLNVFVRKIEIITYMYNTHAV